MINPISAIMYKASLKTPKAKAICNAAKLAGGAVTETKKGFVISTKSFVPPSANKNEQIVETFSRYNYFGKLKKTIKRETVQTKNSFAKLYEILDLKSKSKERTILKWTPAENKFSKGTCIETKDKKLTNEKNYINGKLIADHTGNSSPSGHWVEHNVLNNENVWKTSYNPFIPYGV